MSVASIIDTWAHQEGPFGPEIRIHPTVNVDQDFHYVNFIIELRGYFQDPQLTIPIKLHHERVISVDPFCTNAQYLEDFKRDLEVFTTEAHCQFQKILETHRSNNQLYSSSL